MPNKKELIPPHHGHFLLHSKSVYALHGLQIPDLNIIRRKLTANVRISPHLHCTIGTATHTLVTVLSVPDIGHVRIVPTQFLQTFSAFHAMDPDQLVEGGGEHEAVIPREGDAGHTCKKMTSNGNNYIAD